MVWYFIRVYVTKRVLNNVPLEDTKYLFSLEQKFLCFGGHAGLFYVSILDHVLLRQRAVSFKFRLKHDLVMLFQFLRERESNMKMNWATSVFGLTYRRFQRFSSFISWSEPIKCQEIQQAVQTSQSAQSPCDNALKKVLLADGGSLANAFGFLLL